MRSPFPDFWLHVPSGFHGWLSRDRLLLHVYSLLSSGDPCSLPGTTVFFSGSSEAQAWLHPFSALFQYRYNSGLSHFSSLQAPIAWILQTLLQSPLKSSSWFDCRLHHFIPSAGSLVPSIISFKPPVLSGLAGSILKQDLWHILNVMLHLSRAAIYFSFLKSDFSGIQNDTASELFSNSPFNSVPPNWV